MKANRLIALLFAVLLAAFACQVHAQNGVSPASQKVQIVKIAGRELTGLNAFSLTQEIDAAKASGATALVVDLRRVERLTPAGLKPFEHAVEELGSDRVGLVGAAGQPRDLLSASGTTYRLFDSIEEAAAAIRH